MHKEKAGNHMLDTRIDVSKHTKEQKQEPVRRRVSKCERLASRLKIKALNCVIKVLKSQARCLWIFFF